MDHRKNECGIIGPSDVVVPYLFKDAKRDFIKRAICDILGSSELALTSPHFALSFAKIVFAKVESDLGAIKMAPDLLVIPAPPSPPEVPLTAKIH